MVTTVVGVFRDRHEANEARRELLDVGFSDRDILLSEESTIEPAGEEKHGFWERVRDWFEEDAAYYEEKARHGETVLTVVTDDTRIDVAADVLERHHPLDIEGNTETLELESSQPTDVAPPVTEERATEVTGEQAIPLGEEELKVGKRRVQRGGVRIYTRVRETPVQEDVELTDERTHIERREVDRPAGEEAFRERTIETTEIHEEPVVSKEARVREELVVDTEAEKHTETVRDTVRRTEAEVEEVDEGEALAETTPDAGVTGGTSMETGYTESLSGTGSYESFGRELAQDPLFTGRAWDTIEPDAERIFRERNLGDWDRNRDAIRSAYERYQMGST